MNWLLFAGGVADVAEDVLGRLKGRLPAPAEEVGPCKGFLWVELVGARDAVVQALGIGQGPLSLLRCGSAARSESGSGTLSASGNEGHLAKFTIFVLI